VYAARGYGKVDRSRAEAAPSVQLELSVSGLDILPFRRNRTGHIAILSTIRYLIFLSPLSRPSQSAWCLFSGSASLWANGSWSANSSKTPPPPTPPPSAPDQAQPPTSTPPLDSTLQPRNVGEQGTVRHGPCRNVTSPRLYQSQWVNRQGAHVPLPLNSVTERSETYDRLTPTRRRNKPSAPDLLLLLYPWRLRQNNSLCYTWRRLLSSQFILAPCLEDEVAIHESECWWAAVVCQLEYHTI